MTERAVHGLLARFPDADALLSATRTLAAEQDPADLDAFSPHPVAGLADALNSSDQWVPLSALICAVLAGATTLGLQVYASLDYPFNVGGKPVVSWPAYVIVTFAMTMVGATLGALFSMLLLNRFPHPYHPVFNVDEFADGSRDGYFLLLTLRDPEHARDATLLEQRRQRLQQLGAVSVRGVPQ